MEMKSADNIPIASAESSDYAAYMRGHGPKRLPTRIGFKRLLAMCDEMLRRRETKEGAVRGTHGRYSLELVRLLPKRQRVAFTMRNCGGLGPKQIASLLQTSTGAAKLLVFRARKNLERPSFTSTK